VFVHPVATSTVVLLCATLASHSVLPLCALLVTNVLLESRLSMRHCRGQPRPRWPEVPKLLVLNFFRFCFTSPGDFTCNKVTQIAGGCGQWPSGVVVPVGSGGVWSIWLLLKKPMVQGICLSWLAKYRALK
jgi:hypothetical protein